MTTAPQDAERSSQTAVLPETLYLLMRVVRWETAGMVTNLGDKVAVSRPSDAPECVGFCLVFATQDAAVAAADDGETVLPVRQVER